MPLPELRRPADLFREFVARVRARTDALTWFGANSVVGAIGRATAELGAEVYQLMPVVLSRTTLGGSSGENLEVVAATYGATRGTGARAQVIVVVKTSGANVTDITIGAGSLGGDLIEVDDSTPFEVGNSIRVRSGDGSETDVRTIIAITIGTGPSAGDELDVATLGGTYTPATDDVDVLLRVTIPAGAEIASSEGVAFQTLSALVAGDANAVLDGEGTELSLADKVWAECTTEGSSGNIGPLTLTGFSSPVDGIMEVLNPAPGQGGADEQDDVSLRYEAMHGPMATGQETLASLEALARAGSFDILRLVIDTPTDIGTITLRAVARGGGTMSAAALDQMGTYLGARIRSGSEVLVRNVTFTSVEVSATIERRADVTLETIFRAMASALAAYLDVTRWTEADSVDRADLLGICNGIDGVQNLDTVLFEPAADIEVEIFPRLTRVTVTDADTLESIGADLTQAWG